MKKVLVAQLLDESAPSARSRYFRKTSNASPTVCQPNFLSLWVPQKQSHYSQKIDKFDREAKFERSPERLSVPVTLSCQ